MSADPPFSRCHTESPREPIAVVGIGCRFPGGASDPAAFWRLLEDGVDAITELPADRFSERAFFDPEQGKPGKTHSRWGGFLDAIDRFDPHVFGISPREAARMDPQQRLLLEVAWEALEDAGLPLGHLAGSRTAVFVGISSWDYSILQTSFRDKGVLDVHSNTGCSLSIAANRISYCFDFCGPSAAIDTACSSALVALHLACQSIWNEGCPLALVGGVNALLTPDWFIGFSRLGMLSPDGRCKAFDARANGFVRGEGAGMVVLKPLSCALADGDRVYAVVRGTAVNQDGRTPGMTVPAQEAQESLLRQACQSSGVLPGEIQFVEAHGTGTLVGDPIEARALGAALSAGRPADRPCLLGSVKTNIGHLEAGAGIAGLIKVALSLHHRRVPPNLHFEQPNPEINFAHLRLRVPVRSEPWPQGSTLPLAGVNAFGFGGTNAHAILQGVGPREERLQDLSPSPCYLIPLSARSAPALQAAAQSFAEFLARCPADTTLADIASSAALRRTHHDHRLAVVAHSKEDLAEQLAQAAMRGSAREPRVAFVCAGQGPQWWGMGQQLLREEPIFRAVIEQCDAIVRRLGPGSLLAEMSALRADSRMDETAIAQPALFARQVGLARLWQAWGVQPEAIVGHSVGEVAAAHLAGVFSLEDAVRIIFHRGRCMNCVSSHGGMLAAGISLDEARKLVADHGEGITVAAINSPSAVTLSGEPALLDVVARELESRGLFCRRLLGRYAFHSAQMDPVRDELIASLRGIRPRPATMPLVSSVTGRRVQGEEMGPEYWWRNVRQPVRFADSVDGLIDLGCDVVVELGPHPVLSSAITDCYRQHGKAVTVLSSLRRPARGQQPMAHEERTAILRSLGTLHTLGCPIDWQQLFGSTRGRFVSLPLYSWQRARCWHESEESRMSRLAAPVHSLLGTSTGDTHPVWETRLDLRVTPWLADHCVQRAILMPATAYLELVFAVARELFGPVPCELEDIKFANPCFLTDDRPLWLQTAYDADAKTVEVHTRPLDQGTSPDEELDWTPHLKAQVRAWQGAFAEAAFSPNKVRQRCPREISSERCSAYFRKIGLDYGPRFQGIERAWQGERESLGLLQLASSEEAEEYLFHPALLDLCFQMVVLADEEFGEDGGLYLPFGIARVRLLRRPPARLWCHARLCEKTARECVADLDIFDEAGQRVARISSLRSQRVAGRAGEPLDDLLGAYQWQLDSPGQDRPADNSAPGTWLLFADRGGLGSRLARQLRANGDACALVSPGSAFDACGDGCYRINPAWPEDMVRLIKTITRPGRPPCRGIVHLWNLNAPCAEDLTTESLEASQDMGLMSLVHLVQAWDRRVDAPAARLFVVTRGAQPVESEPEIAGIAQSPAIGLGRVIVGEYPRLRCRLVDLDPQPSGPDVKSLFEEMRIDDEEDEIALREAGRFVHRFGPAPVRTATVAERSSPPLPDGRGSDSNTLSYRLIMRQSGTLDGLAVQAIRRQPPGPGEVEIEVVAAGLNFSDVMKALGLYPGADAGPVSLGAECSGRIVTLGEGVSGLRLGDEVLAVASFAFGSHAIARADLVALRPTNLSPEEAAAAPIAFLTAAYALEDLGRMRVGDRVLIHSASGGVGLAAVQLARLAGAELFATAGSQEKRDYLINLGIKHVMDSRSLAFADEVMDYTKGAGVDLILNSLPGDAIARGLACLADSGRFLEIGKRDIHNNMRVGLRPFRNNLSFIAIDLDRVMRLRPALLGKLLHDVVRRLGDGTLTPLPLHAWPLSSAIEAFRFMQQAKHVGKVVLTLRDRPAALLPAEAEPITFRADASYLITGGLGGFGLALAGWMVQRGARYLVLVGRRGPHTPEAKQAIAEMEKQGAKIIVRRADVSQAEEVADLLAEVDRLPPLRGIVHAAMVLEDALLLNLDHALMRRVLAPKVSGAWNLHTLTKDRSLDFFVLFSSLSSVFGHAGQGNYAAANAFLDALAWHRRTLGLPALTINWGYLGEVGYLAERSSLGERLQRQGVQSFTVRQALTLLERAMQQQRTQVSVLRIDWSRWRGLGVTGRVSPRFAHLCDLASQDSGGEPGSLATQASLLAKTPAERVTLLDTLLRGKVARVLGASPERIEADTPLLNLGLDSLMAIELRNWIEGELRITLPIVELMRGPTLSRLVELLSQQMTADPLRNGSSRIEELPANVQDLSPDEVDSMLSTLMARRANRLRSSAPPHV